ncbi:uncharacterized protein LOC133205382 [Saccostrea echinata]|uniref:uncharacterized protein LOC133205382 n=1 Tax=Saccostrea echinata TaxID=191078 RepID=UPI002A833420|nr:uncharacterized protein LOC133205382 [Saccostrea echinata]
MTDLNTNLQNYLSKGNENSSSGFGKFNLGKLNLFQKKSQPLDEDLEPNDVANSWFTKAKADPCLPSLSKKQRILGFVMFLLLGTFCFSLASLYIPLLLLKARKFAMLYTLGSLFAISSFSFLWGPVHHIKHLFSVSRLPFTAAYLGTMLATIYFSVWVKSTVLTVICAVLQVITLIWYVVSYIPGGQTGLKFFSKIFYAAASKTVQKTLPV